jgi:hypothetical protein
MYTAGLLEVGEGCRGGKERKAKGKERRIKMKGNRIKIRKNRKQSEERG